MVVWACELGEGSLKMGKQVFRLPILWGMGFAVLLMGVWQPEMLFMFVRLD